MQKKLVTWIAVCCLMAGAAPSYAAPEDEPGASEMAADIIFARPVGIAITALGAAAFVVSLPFSALGGNIGKAGEALVVEPGRAAFVRCLGCRSSGRAQTLTD